MINVLNDLIAFFQMYAPIEMVAWVLKCSFPLKFLLYLMFEK